MKRYPFQRFGLAATFAAVTALGAAGSVSAQDCDDELVIGDMQPLSGNLMARSERRLTGA